jgi:hypothetical protein
LVALDRQGDFHPVGYGQAVLAITVAMHALTERVPWSRIGFHRCQHPVCDEPQSDTDGTGTLVGRVCGDCLMADHHFTLAVRAVYHGAVVLVDAGFGRQ